LPPLTVTEDECDRAAHIISEVLRLEHVRGGQAAAASQINDLSSNTPVR
jgi:hypothetical protein